MCDCPKEKKFLLIYVHVSGYIGEVLIFLKCNLQLKQSGAARADSAATCQKLKKDLQAVFNVLPKDMQQLLLMNPERAALLQGSLEPTKLPGQPSLKIGVMSSTSPR